MEHHTARKSSPIVNEHLAAEVARADALFASIGEPVIATDENGRIMKINEAMLELFELNASDVVGKRYLDMFHAYDANGNEIDPLSRPIMRALQEGKRVTDTLYYKRKSGAVFPARVTVSPTLLDGHPIGTIQVTRDITREQQIDRAKTEFVSLASHQLRTPLTAVRWYMELMLMGKMGKFTEEQQHAMGEVYKVNIRLIELVDALLSVARIEVGTLTIRPVMSDIKSLAQDVVFELQQDIAEKNLVFRETYDSAIPQIPLDPDLTRVIFQNLLTNAVKYTPPHGQIDLTVELEKSSLLITVADTGYGIPKHQQKQLFGKLFRADNVRTKDTGGTGLGLYIVKSIVENSKGKIWFKSEENKGTTFYVRLPLKGMVAFEGNGRPLRKANR